MQFNSQSSAVSPQVGLGVGVPAPGLNTVTSATLQQQPNSIHQQSSQQALISTGPKEAGSFYFTFIVVFFLLLRIMFLFGDGQREYHCYSHGTLSGLEPHSALLDLVFKQVETFDLNRL